MAVRRRIKMPIERDAGSEAEVAPSQRAEPEPGRYLLQVDRQTKSSYTTAEAARAAALAIKKRYPVVQVSIYDSVESTRTPVEAPASK